MRPVYSPLYHPGQVAKVLGADRHSATPAFRFVLSRCLGSSAHYSLWLLEDTRVLEHWIMLADGVHGLNQSIIFLLQSANQLLPAAHYDEGPCRFLSLPLDGENDTADQTMRQALDNGCLTLTLEGQHLKGQYLLQRVGAGRGHTWQFMRLGKSTPAQLATVSL